MKVKLLIHRLLNQLGYDILALDYVKSLQNLATSAGDFVPKGHYYSPFPDLKDIREREAEIFSEPEQITGIDLRENHQMSWLQKFKDIYPELPDYKDTKTPGFRYYYINENFSYSDAIVLYSMLRLLKPKRLIEVGSGFSSAVTLDTNEFYLNRSVELTFIDPYPNQLRQLLKAEDRTRVRIIDKPVQRVGLSTFQELGDGDILFIDSTHVSKVGSDVNYLYFEILPLLNKGVYIHIHDIFYPFEYPKIWVYQGRGWNEAYLLRAFLLCNPSFQIEYFQHYMFLKHHDFFEKNLPLCLKSGGDNIWIRKVE